MSSPSSSHLLLPPSALSLQATYTVTSHASMVCISAPVIPPDAPFKSTSTSSLITTRPETAILPGVDLPAVESIVSVFKTRFNIPAEITVLILEYAGPKIWEEEDLESGERRRRTGGDDVGETSSVEDGGEECDFTPTRSVWKLKRRMMGSLLYSSHKDVHQGSDTSKSTPTSSSRAQQHSPTLYLLRSSSSSSSSKTTRKKKSSRYSSSSSSSASSRLSIPLLRPIQHKYMNINRSQTSVENTIPKVAKKERWLLGTRYESSEIRVGCLGVGVDMEILEPGWDEEKAGVGGEMEVDGDVAISAPPTDSSSTSPGPHRNPTTKPSRFHPYHSPSSPPLKLTLTLNWTLSIPLSLPSHSFLPTGKRHTHIWYLRREDSEDVRKVLDELKSWKQVSLRVEGVSRGGGVRVWRAEVGLFAC